MKDGSFPLSFRGAAGTFYLLQHRVRPFYASFADARYDARVQLARGHCELQCPRCVDLIPLQPCIEVQLISPVYLLQPLADGVEILPDGDEFRPRHTQLATSVMSAVTGVEKSYSSPPSFQQSKDTPVLLGFLGSVAFAPSRTVWVVTSLPPPESKLTV